MCGTPVAAQLAAAEGPARAAGGKAIATPQGFTPEVEGSLLKTLARAREVATALGAEKLTVLIGGVLGLLGAIAPFYHVELPMFIGAVSPADIHIVTPSLVHEGPIGTLIILLAIILGAGPFLTVRTRTLSLIGFGVSCAVLGIVLGDYFRSATFGRTFAIGFYYAVIGFALVSSVYAKRAYEADHP